jgi:hypothetical protein
LMVCLLDAFPIFALFTIRWESIAIVIIDVIRSSPRETSNRNAHEVSVYE